MNFDKRKHGTILFFCVAFVFASIFVVQKSIAEDQSGNVYFGYPMGFVKQNFNSYDPIKYYQSFSLKRESAKTEFFAGRFVFSLLSTFFLLEFLIYLLEGIYFKIRKE